MTSEVHSYHEPVLDDTIDLRPYLLALVKAWPIVLGVAFVAALAAGVWTLTRPPVYEASVDVAIVEYRTTFSLEPSIETVQDTVAQREALVGLVINATIAEEVLAEIGDTLPMKYQDMAELMDMVVADGAEGDLVTITARATDPDVAARVATAWAETYEMHINDLYEGLAPGMLEALVAQTEIAQTEYETAQNALVEFTRETDISTLERQVGDLEALRSAQIQDRTSTLTASLAERRRLLTLRDSAVALLDQVQQAGTAGSATGALAITLLKAQAYASQSLPAGLTVDIGTTAGSERTATNQAADVKALAQSLDQAIAALDEKIGDQVAGLTTAEDDQLTGTSQDNGAGLASLSEIERLIQDLRAELERARAEESDLTRTRDVALETYSALARKVSEQRVESGLVPSVVRVASKAMRPSDPEGRSTLQYTVLAGIAGLVIASLAVFMLTYLYPETSIGDLFRRRKSAQGGQSS